MTVNLLLELLAVIALIIAAFTLPVPPSRVQWGWLAVLILTLVLIFGGLKL